MSLTQTQIDNEVAHAAAGLTTLFSYDQLGDHFVRRTLENEFETLGRIAMQGRMPLEGWQYCWIGFEVLRNNPNGAYLNGRV
jgi:hypothetical protein